MYIEDIGRAEFFSKFFQHLQAVSMFSSQFCNIWSPIGILDSKAPKSCTKLLTLHIKHGGRQNSSQIMVVV